MYSGSIIYKQFPDGKYFPLDQLSPVKWFALKPEYGSSYGPIQKTYRFIRDPKLLDIGNGNVRQMIVDTISPDHPEIVYLSDPNNQYSGGVTNKKYHDLVMRYFGDKYDGTIIDSENLTGNTTYPVDDLDGSTEVVIFDDFTKLLEELPETNTSKELRETNTSRFSSKRKTEEDTKLEFNTSKEKNEVILLSDTEEDASEMKKKYSPPTKKIRKTKKIKTKSKSKSKSKSTKTTKSKSKSKSNSKLKSKNRNRR